MLADTGYWHVEQITQLQTQGVNVLVPPLDGMEGQKPRALAAQSPRDDRAPDQRTGKHAYQRRQQIIEPVFAHIKHLRGITRVLRRGKTAVQAEIDLIATTHNLLKLYRHPLTAG